jgi:hypothetical protein
MAYHGVPGGYDHDAINNDVRSPSTHVKHEHGQEDD